MPAPEQSPAMEEGLLLTRHRGSSGHNMEADTAANHILASVKEQELQFERLTRELEVERQIVANQLERCRLGAESPGDASSSSSEKSLPWRSADVSTSGDAKSRVTDSSLSPNYHIRSESEQVSPYCTEQTSLHERSAGNSRTSTQMTSYSDSGYQEAGNGYYSNQNLKAELRLQNSFPGSGTTGPGPGTLIRNARAEGQAAQTQAVPGRAMRRVCSVPSRTQSPQYACGVSPSRGSLRVTGSSGGYASPVVTEPKPLSSIFSTTLPLSQRPASSSANANTTGGGGGGGGGGSPYATQKNSPAALRRMGSSNSRSGGSRNTSPYQVSGGGGGGSRMGSPLVMADGVSPPLTKQPGPSSSSPARGSMTAVPQHYGSSTLPRSLLHDAPPYGPHDTQPYGPHDAPPYGAHDAQPYGPHDTQPYGPHDAQPYGPHDAPPYGPHDVQPYRAHDAPPYGPHDTQPYGPHGYDIYERMTRPDSLTGTDTQGDGNIQGLRSSYATQMGQDLRSAMSPDRHITPIYEDRTYQGPLYRSPSHAPQGTLYRSTSGVGSLQRTASQRSTMTYQRNNYAPTATYAEPYRLAQYGRHGPVIMDDSATRSPSIDSIQKDPREFAWRDPALTEVIHMLQHQFPSVQANAAAYLQHLCYGDNRTKVEVCRLGGIKHLVDLLDHKVLEVQKNSCGALRNLVYGKALDENKTAVRNAGGVPALLRLLRKTVDAEVRELVTGVLWNLSSCDALKMTIIRDALTTVTNTVIIPHSGWSSAALDDDHKLKFHSSLVLRNTTGCLRNLSSAGEEARRPLRTCEGLVDSLLYVIKACVNTADFDSKIVENCICTLRNLSYRLELEMPPSRLLGGQQLDGLLGSESPSEETDTSCWGRKRKRKKKRSLQGDTWDGVGPIPGFSKPPQGAEMLWHPGVVKPYLTLLAESSNPATLEGAAGSLQNLSAGNWKFAWYIRAAVRKEKGLPILVELLRMDNDGVVNSVATALRNMSLDIRNKELIGKYAMRDLVNRLPGGSPPQLSDETVAAVCCTLHEVTSRNMENAKALADTGGIEKLVNITKTRGDRYSLKVVKAAAQVLNTLWQYRDLRILYKKDGWNQNHFLTPVSTLERDRFKSQPALPTGSIQMSPVSHPAGSATSSPAVLGIKESRPEYQRAPSAMQFYNHQGDNSVHKNQYTGSGKPSPFYYPSPTREEPRRTQPPLYYEDPARRNYDTYRMYMQAPRGYEEPYLEEVITYPPTAADYVSHQPHGLKSTNNYVDFYSSTRRRPSYRAEHYPGSPDSWV